ncbi:MAG: hypothetical protein HKN20_16615 [Gemmatimonadetes bacterium]|nr:hypothetical protein [Gemmatimonadota bacterium]
MDKQQSLGSLIYAWRRLFYLFGGIASVLAVVVSLVLPNWYTGTVTAMPPQEGESRGGVMQLFTQMGVDFGAGGLLSQTPMTDVMIGIVKSRHIRGQVVDLHDLVEVYDAESREHAIHELGMRISATTSPEGLIQVRVEDKDRQRAADMANSFMRFLDTFNREASVDQARRTIRFIENTLDSNRTRLVTAARNLEEFQKRNRTIELTEQTRVTVEAISRLESEKAELEIQRGVLSKFATGNNQQLRQLDLRIRETEQMLGEMQNGYAAGSDSASSTVLLPLSQIPALSLQLADLTRELLVQDRVYQFLTSQLEDARIKQSRDMQVITILDAAVPPIKKSRPRRSLICLLTAGLSLFLTAVLVIGADYYLRYAKTHEPSTTEERFLLRASRTLEKWGGPKVRGAGTGTKAP